MTPAIQKQIESHTRSEAEAAAQSLNEYFQTGIIIVFAQDDIIQ